MLEMERDEAEGAFSCYTPKVGPGMNCMETHLKEERDAVVANICLARGNGDLYVDSSDDDDSLFEEVNASDEEMAASCNPNSLRLDSASKMPVGYGAVDGKSSEDDASLFDEVDEGPVYRQDLGSEPITCTVSVNCHVNDPNDENHSLKKENIEEIHVSVLTGSQDDDKSLIKTPGHGKLIHMHRECGSVSNIKATNSETCDINHAKLETVASTWEAVGADGTQYFNSGSQCESQESPDALGCDSVHENEWLEQPLANSMPGRRGRKKSSLQHRSTRGHVLGCPGLSDSNGIGLSDADLACLMEYGPIRITRSMASARNSSKPFYGADHAEEILQISKQDQDSPLQVMERITGKRTGARGGRSGWDTNKVQSWRKFFLADEINALGRGLEQSEEETGLEVKPYSKRNWGRGKSRGGQIGTNRNKGLAEDLVYGVTNITTLGMDASSCCEQPEFLQSGSVISAGSSRPKAESEQASGLADGTSSQNNETISTGRKGKETGKLSSPDAPNSQENDLFLCENYNELASNHFALKEGSMHEDCRNMSPETTILGAGPCQASHSNGSYAEEIIKNNSTDQEQWIKLLQESITHEVHINATAAVNSISDVDLSLHEDSPHVNLGAMTNQNGSEGTLTSLKETNDAGCSGTQNDQQNCVELTENASISMPTKDKDPPCESRKVVSETSEIHCPTPVDIDTGTQGEDVCSGITEGGNVVQNKVSKEDIAVGGNTSGVGWVLCDDCQKWRCISADLADAIEATNARWTCKDNPNKNFSDCSIPQEKTNSEINAELNLSDASCCEENGDGDEDKDSAADSKLAAEDGIFHLNSDDPQTTWTHIKHNIFRSRRRKAPDNDDSLVCHCKPPEDGSSGCGENCINRMVFVECVPDICPCGDACSNQQFRKRMYAKVGLFRCGKKGYGLRILEYVPKGTFIIEYVGEVLDLVSFEERQKEYAHRGQKHFYFMTLNSNEVIDACAKGNLGRFINHSCEPNCQTEKWCVNGEICIGLFAIRDLVQGEEITFDYNYERLYGAAAKRCHCGSSRCQGYIGGDPLTPRAVVESDSDEDDPEPVMLEQESEEENLVEDVVPAKKSRDASETASWEPNMVRPNRLKRKPASSNEADGEATLRVKRAKVNKKASNGIKGLILEIDTGRGMGNRASRPLYGSEVSGKLDEMLDEQGGLVKRKDISKQYMKLLVLSAATGDTSRGAASCSVRDISLLLDALLKTSSRTVLCDIIQKNGLQMLHNLVKQSRRNWKNIPILRKLMKVLELLASKKVLTVQHMTFVPPREGMESFRETIWELTRHGDNEVQQYARRFQTNWLPSDQLGNDRFPFHQGFSGSGDSRYQDHKYNGRQRFFRKRLLYPREAVASHPRDVAVSTSRSPNLQPVESNIQVPTHLASEKHDPDFEQTPAKHECSTNDNITVQRVDEEQGTRRRKRISRWDEPAPPVEGAKPGPCVEQINSQPSESSGRPDFPSQVPSTSGDRALAVPKPNHYHQSHYQHNRPSSFHQQDCPPGFGANMNRSSFPPYAERNARWRDRPYRPPARPPRMDPGYRGPPSGPRRTTGPRGYVNQQYGRPMNNQFSSGRQMGPPFRPTGSHQMQSSRPAQHGPVPFGMPCAQAPPLPSTQHQSPPSCPQQGVPPTNGNNTCSVPAMLSGQPVQSPRLTHNSSNGMAPFQASSGVRGPFPYGPADQGSQFQAGPLPFPQPAQCLQPPSAVPPGFEGHSSAYKHYQDRDKGYFVEESGHVLANGDDLEPEPPVPGLSSKHVPTVLTCPIAPISASCGKIRSSISVQNAPFISDTSQGHIPVSVSKNLGEKRKMNQSEVCLPAMEYPIRSSKDLTTCAEVPKEKEHGCSTDDNNLSANTQGHSSDGHHCVFNMSREECPKRLSELNSTSNTSSEKEISSQDATPEMCLE